jgi:biotin transport system substrate-specific component
MQAQAARAEAARPTLLADALWPQSSARALRFVALAAVGVVLLALAAKIKVPFYPVPMTLQTLVVPLIAAAYGARLGAATIVAYIGCGMIGLPVFTNTPPAVASPLYLLGPTGGYLIGWIGAVWLVGTLIERGQGRTLPRLAGVIFLGSVVTFVCGVSWLAFAASVPPAMQGIGLMRAIEVGYLPFVLGDLVKVALAASIVRGSWTLIGRRGA